MNQIRSDYPRRSKVVTAALAGGALIGLLLMADSLVERSTEDATAVALVNGVPITAQRFSRALQRLVPGPPGGPGLVQARAVLDRLIEEELLLQRGLEMGITDNDLAVRKSLVDAMIQKIVKESQRVPDEATLQDFYRDNRAYFAGTAALRVRRMVFRGDDRRARAEAAYKALEDQDWNAVAETLADTDFVQLPGSFMPVSKLRNYLGPGLTAQLEAMNVNEFSLPLEQAGSLNILLLQDRQPATAPSYTAARELVLREYQRRADDAALRSYLQSLYDQAEIIIDWEFMAGLD